MGKLDFLNVLFPDRCAICGHISGSDGEVVCSRCKRLILPITGPVCNRCGRPIYNSNLKLCAECAKKEYIVLSGKAMFIYDKYMKRAVIGFKFGGNKSIGIFFAKLLLARYRGWLSEMEFDAVIPVPVHKKKLRFRGFNQAAVVAGVIADGIGVRMDEDILVRNKDTKPQKALDEEERFKNLQNSFCVERYSRIYNRVLIVDDIYTTGATIEGCGAALRKVGVSEIHFLSLCIGDVPQL